MSIELEPRLKAYLKARKETPGGDLEEKFWITEQDKRVIREYFNRSKNEAPKGVFPSTRDKLMEDSRVPKVIKPQKNESIVNRGMFAGGNGMYDEMPNNNVDINMDIRDVNMKWKSFNGSKNFNDSRFDPRADPKMYPGVPDLNKYDSPYRAVNPKGSDGVGCFVEPILSDRPVQSNEKRKAVVPNDAFTNGRLTTTADYTLTRFNGKNSAVREAFYMDGTATRTKKSYGFRDDFDHKYQFVDPNFNSPDVCVEPWSKGGESSRIFNKSIKHIS